MIRHLRPLGSSNEPTVTDRLLAALAYIILASVVTLNVLQTSGLIMLFMLLGFLYWILIGRNPRRIRYFLRYHFVQVIMLNLVLSTLLWLLVEFMQLLVILFPIVSVIISMLFDPFPYMNIPLSLMQMFVFCIGLVMAGYSLMGEETEIPYISEGVRYWVRW